MSLFKRWLKPTNVRRLQLEAGAMLATELASNRKEFVIRYEQLAYGFNPWVTATVVAEWVDSTHDHKDDPVIDSTVKYLTVEIRVENYSAKYVVLGHGDRARTVRETGVVQKRDYHITDGRFMGTQGLLGARRLHRGLRDGIRSLLYDLVELQVTWTGESNISPIREQLLIEATN